MVTVNSSFYAQYVRPEGGGPSNGGWIGLYKEGAGARSYLTYYKDTEAALRTSLFWSKGPSSEGDWEMRYYDADYNLLASAPLRAKRETIHAFTRRYPSSENAVTTASRQPQSSCWPTYLPYDETRLFVMERSKNPSLVVYYANLKGLPPPRISYQKVCPPLPSELEFRSEDGGATCPVIARWYSWGWTPEPELNALNSMQRRFMGATFERVAEKSNEFEGYLNALSKKVMRLTIGVDPTTGRRVPILLGAIDGRDAVLRKVYVKTSGSIVPTVDYADLYGVDTKTGKLVQERINA